MSIFFPINKVYPIITFLCTKNITRKRDPFYIQKSGPMGTKMSFNALYIKFVV